MDTLTTQPQTSNAITTTAVLATNQSTQATTDRDDIQTVSIKPNTDHGTELTTSLNDVSTTTIKPTTDYGTEPTTGLNTADNTFVESTTNHDTKSTTGFENVSTLTTKYTDVDIKKVELLY